LRIALQKLFFPISLTADVTERLLAGDNNQNEEEGNNTCFQIE